MIRSRPSEQQLPQGSHGYTLCTERCHSSPTAEQHGRLTPWPTVHRTLLFTRLCVDPLEQTVHVEHMRALSPDCSVSTQPSLEHTTNMTHSKDNHHLALYTLDNSSQTPSGKYRSHRPRLRHRRSLCLGQISRSGTACGLPERCPISRLLRGDTL